MIVTLTPHPSTDRTVPLAGDLRRGAVQRTTAPGWSVAGGKGVNISRACVSADVPTLAVLPAEADDPFLADLAAAGIAAHPVPGSGPVRVNLTLTEPGPQVWAGIRQGLEEHPSGTTSRAELRAHARLTPVQATWSRMSGDAELATDDQGRRLLQVALDADPPASGVRQAWLVHRDDPAVRAAVEARVAAATAAGMKPLVERYRYRWTPGCPLPERTGRLTFRPEPDDEVVLEVLRRVHSATLDAHARKAIEVPDDTWFLGLGPIAANLVLDDLQEHLAPR